MPKKNYGLILFLCIGQYFSQGLSSLPDQAIYYLTRESWKLSASLIGFITFITAVAWYLKIIFAYFIDNVSIKGKTTTYYLYFSYILILLSCFYIVFFGLNLISLIIIGILINIGVAFADVSVDKHMAQIEKKEKIAGKIQSQQWTSLGIAGLIVALGGAWIAKTWSAPLNYKIAYGLYSIVPIILLFFLFFYFKEPIKHKKAVSFKSIIKANFKELKNKKFLIGLLFIACLQLSPSFGLPLMIKCREVLKVSKMFLGVLGALGTVLGVIGYLIYYKWVYKFNTKKMLYFMVVFSGLTNLFYLYLPNKWVLLSYNVLFGAFSGITFMILLAFFVRIIPTGFEAFFYALVTSISNFCARGGSFFGGLIYDKTNYETAVIVSSVLTLICVFFIPHLKLNNQKMIRVSEI